MSVTRLRRRRLLLALLGCGALWLGKSSPFSPPALAPGRALVNDVIDRLFSDRGSARAVGLAYLAVSGPAEQRPEDLLRAILAAHSDDGARLPAMPRLGDRVAAAVRRDFAAQAVVSLDGWILCLTEARLCALAAVLT